MKFRLIKVVALFVTLVAAASCSKERGNTWNEATKTFEMPAYNLEWNLSGIDGLIIPEQDRQPSDKLFMAGAGEMTIGLISFEDANHVFNVDNAENFVNTILPAEFLKVGLSVDSKNPVETWKSEYLSREAINFAAKVHMTVVGDESAPLFGGGYIFSMDGRVFISFVLAPPYFLKQHGDAPLNSMLNRLTYIEASR